MFTRPYSIYIEKRPIRIVFLVNPESTSLETVDKIIDYNRSLWGGRFNPIILTDGHTIDDKWWQFLRDIDPDVIKPLMPLDSKLIEKIEKFLSPLEFEQFREDQQSTLRTRIDTRNTPANIDINSLNFPALWTLHGGPTLGIFNLDEMDDDIGKRFVLRNFGTYEPTTTTLHGGGTFCIPRSLESVLELGEVPSEVHEGFRKAGVPFSREAFSKKSVQRPESWAIIDKENGQIQHVGSLGGSLHVRPETQRFRGELSEINKKVRLITDRESLTTDLLEFARTPDIVFQDQICALPNTKREVEVNTLINYFDVVIGDEFQDIVHFWNRPLAVGRFKRQFMNQMWLPKTLATDPNMEEALYAWFRRITHLDGNDRSILRFVSFSTEKRELEDIAKRFREQFHAHNLAVHTAANCFEEPQIPNFRPEDSFFGHTGGGMDIHRVQGNEGILELAEPKGIAPCDGDGHWMADFYIEFIPDKYENREDTVSMAPKTLFWRLPNRNYLTRFMFDKPSRIKQNGIPSVMMRIGERVLRFTLEDAESIVASLFCSDNRPIYEHSDPRTQVVARPYYSVDVSDKGKYLQGVLELFGNLTFANWVLSNPYWRSMFDELSKNTGGEQHAHKTIANKLKKEIDKSGSLVDKPAAVESIAKLVVNEAKKLDLKQKEFPFKKFTQIAEYWWKKEMAHMSEFQDTSEMTMVDLGFGSEDVKRKLSQLTQRNIIQIGVKPRCPNCGMVHWYHVDDIGQHPACQGCRTQFSLDPELTWHYRLNGLMHVAHALHGITPEILVLGQLFDKSRTSFLFSSNLNLLTVAQDESTERLDKVAEVDIACIQDGKFIIGEVKQSMSLFSKHDFDTMAEIAARVKPDIVLFSCIDSRQPTPNIVNHMERIRNRLSPLEIDVIWYELEYLDYSDGV